MELSSYLASQSLDFQLSFLELACKTGFLLEKVLLSVLQLLSNAFEVLLQIFFVLLVLAFLFFQLPDLLLERLDLDRALRLQVLD